jgi:hypothetical protein
LSAVNAPSDRDLSASVAFGQIWSSQVPLHAFLDWRSDRTPADIVVRRVDALSVRGAPVRASEHAALFPDGVRLWIRDEARFDLYAGHGIDWAPGENWSGRFPPEMFSTLTALCLAMKGKLPLHGSAVEIGGKGVLVCGPSGSGKSTIAAGLIVRGARLISDDLSVVSRSREGDLTLCLGRPSIRLFPQVAREMFSRVPRSPDIVGDKGKYLVHPATVPPFERIPLHTLILLEDRQHEPRWAPEGGLSEVLLGLQFRPTWLRFLPGQAERLAIFRSMADNVKVARQRVPPIRSPQILQDVCARMFELVGDGAL